MQVVRVGMAWQSILRTNVHPDLIPLGRLRCVHSLLNVHQSRERNRFREATDMLRIAICDDISAELQHIAALAHEYLTKRNVSADIRTFSHPDALLTACESRTFHIFFARYGHANDRWTCAWAKHTPYQHRCADYLYCHRAGFALDAYSVNPLHYLLKPVDKGALFAALELAAERVKFGEETTVTVKTRDGLRTFSTDVVVYCEYVRHTVVYVLASGERVETLTIPGSFAEHIAPLLRDRRFIQPHAAFVVNMSCVDRLSKEVFMKGGAFASVFRQAVFRGA